MSPRALRRPALAAWILLSALLAAPLHAQFRPSVEPGDRVRVVAHDGSGILGTVVEVRGDSLHVGVGSLLAARAIHVSSIRQLDVYGGRRRNTLRGAGIGALAGVAAGTLIGASAADCGGKENCFPIFPKEFLIASGTVLGAGFGAVGGAVVGTFVQTKRWEPVYRGAAPAVSFTPDGLSVALHVRL